MPFAFDAPPPSPERAFAIFRSLTAESQARQTLASLAKLAAWASEAPIAALVATLPERVETLATHGLALRSLDAKWDYAAAGYSRDAFFAAPDLTRHPYFAAQPFVRDAPKLRAALRVPVRSDRLPFAVALTVADVKTRRPEAWPSRRMRDMLEEMAAIAENEIMVAAEIARASDGDPETDPTFEELTAAVERAALPTLLLDEEMRLLVANGPIMALLGVPSAALDRPFEDLSAPGGDAIARLARWSLAGREPVADVAFALAREAERAEAPTASISAFPVGVRGREAPLMLIQARDVSAPLRAADRLEALIGPPDFAPDPGELGPTSSFLDETLVTRTAVRARGAMSYVTLRLWRTAIKEHQIKALQALKRNPPPAFVDEIAAEIEKAVEQMFGRAAFGVVVPTPCGHSAPERCLSARIAERVAARLGLPAVAALGAETRLGSSHPRDNARRPPLRLLEAPGRSTLLIDDVATSGRHLEEATALLKPSAGAVFAIAWIGGQG